MDTGNTAWVLASSALVLLMTPGLAFFYGGMVRSKSVLNMLMMNFICIAVVTVAWILYGWSVAFGNANDAKGSGFWGGLTQWGMHGIATGAGSGHPALYGSSGVPIFAVACFQLMFAIITPALISGAIADRTKFVGWTVYVLGWVTFIYFPVAHWVFSPNGFINAKLHVMDFAGGTAVEINSGAGALACALVVGKRIGYKKDPMRPHNVPLVMIGAALLWFGWFGFNAGSSLTCAGQASLVLMNTQVAACTALLGWLAAEKIQHGTFTTIGAASGAVAGMVAITPACASVSPIGAIFVGLIAGIVCCYAVNLKHRFDLDDSLDVVGVHLVGGIVGTLLIGLFAAPDEVAAFSNGARAGLFYGGGPRQLLDQAAGAGIVLVYTFTVSFVLAKLVHATIGLRVGAEAEMVGVDQAQHAETAYDWGGLSGTLHRAAVGVATATARAQAPATTPARERH
ncbi:ammonium transporter [Actinocrinis puniceicyclus]